MCHGRIVGWRISAEGTALHAELLAEAMTDGDVVASLRHAHAVFEPLNAALEQVCTDWQLRDGAVNDHASAAYDHAVIERLVELNTGAGSMLDALARRVPRFGGYRSRLDDALRRVRDGDRSAVARPLSGSYHDVWMELHQDFLVGLGPHPTSDDA